MITWLQHARIRLALHTLRPGEGRPLLVLHGLGERCPEGAPEELRAWPGPLFALDFTGHGASQLPVGGGYTAELLMADADTALAHLGRATLVGYGVGAYAALLLAGARPEEIRGAALCDGPGLAGGGPKPLYGLGPAVVPATAEPPDPFALLELTRDVRPPDYAGLFARLAATRSGLDPAIAVCAVERPPWLAALAGADGVVEQPLEAALVGFARAPDGPGAQ